MSIAHPVARAWLSTGGTGAQNYDEFATDAEITEIVTANPASALAIEMPHRTPEAVAARASFSTALPEAVARLAELKAAGRFTAHDDIAGLYRIAAPEQTAYGLVCMVDIEQISASADEPGLVIRNEEVFVEKVRERTALAAATDHLLSAVLLLQPAKGRDLHDALAKAAAELGAPDVTDVDGQGREHAIWALPGGAQRDSLLELAGRDELIVADGNHRSLAAQQGGLRRFLAVVTTPQSVVIQPYNRLVTELPAPLDELLTRLRAAGASTTPLAGRAESPTRSGVVHLYAAGEQAFAVALPAPRDADVVERMDHTLVERVLLRDALGLDPGDKRIGYIGGDYPAAWLCDEVDAGRADLAVLVAPVPVADFVAVNLARLKLPRKSTWFTPKVRAGLVLADLVAEQLAAERAGQAP